MSLLDAIITDYNQSAGVHFDKTGPASLHPPHVPPGLPIMQCCIRLILCRQATFSSNHYSVRSLILLVYTCVPQTQIWKEPTFWQLGKRTIVCRMEIRQRGARRKPVLIALIRIRADPLASKCLLTRRMNLPQDAWVANHLHFNAC